MGASVDLHQIRVRPVGMSERARWRERMNEYHYLGFVGAGGEQVWYVGEEGGEWVALIGWCTSAFKSCHRDHWIGWEESIRYRRLKYIANNFRFLILPAYRVKNLATRVLSLNLKRLSADWEQFYGHEILAVETFVDLRFLGTCYKAANWQVLGKTKGYGRHSGAYYYHGRPKTIFVRALTGRSLSRLANPKIPLIGEEEQMQVNWKKYVLRNKESLFSTLREVADYRDVRGKRHSLVTILAIAVCAMLSGAKNFKAIAQWAKGLSKYDLKRLGAWHPRSQVPPSLTTFKRVLKGLDSDQFDSIIYQWLSGLSFAESEAIAFDGKTLRGSYHGDQKTVHLLSGVLHNEKITISQTNVGDKTNEIPMLQNALKRLPIKGKVITADAMHTQAETARIIVKDKKANYVFTVKENQQKLYDQLRGLDHEAFSP